MPEIQTELHGRRLGLANINEGGGLIINRANSEQTLLGMVTTVSIPSASVLALNATPFSIVPAQGAGIAIIPTRMAIRKPAGVAYAGVAVGEDLVLKYTNGSGAQVTGVIETTGFLDQATDQTRIVGDPGSTGATAGDYAPVANAALVLHLLTGEVITGDQPLIVKVWWDVLKVAFAV